MGSTAVPLNTERTAEDMLRADAACLLQTWLEKRCVLTFLQSLPEYAPAASLDTCIDKFRAAVQTLLQDRVSSSAAMQTAPFLAETTSYPFAVMLLAASMASATPPSLLCDTVIAVMHSLLHKDFHLQLGRWQNKSRYWSVGTADTGEGKRGAMKPIIQTAQRVLRSASGLSPGSQADDFHFQQSCTTAAAIDKLRRTDGYLLLHSDEAGACLDLSFSGSSAGATKKGEHVDLTMFLDSAHGDEFSHTTMLDRRRHAKKEPTHPHDPVQDIPPLTVSTNMQVCWLQQELYFLQYWCLAAHTKPIGLVQRCLFSFGRALPAPEPKLNLFWKEVFLPFVEHIFNFVLHFLGPRAVDAENRSLTITATQEQLLFQLEELLKVFSSSRHLSSVARGAMPKCLYWLGTVIRTNFLLNEAIKSYQKRSDMWALQCWEASDANFLTAVNFLSQRYLFGMMVVATSVMEMSWCRLADDPKHKLDATTQAVLQVLRAHPVSQLTVAELFQACLDLGWLSRRGNAVEQNEAKLQVHKIFCALQVPWFKS